MVSIISLTTNDRLAKYIHFYHKSTNKRKGNLPPVTLEYSPKMFGGLKFLLYLDKKKITIGRNCQPGLFHSPKRVVKFTLSAANAFVTRIGLAEVLALVPSEARNRGL
jgi:hypothetical protein